MPKPNFNNIWCEYTKTETGYDFTTYQKVLFCPVCKNEYVKLNRIYCLSCIKKEGLKIKLAEKTKERVGRLSLDLKKYSCCCLSSSFYAWGKALFDKKTICKHIIIAIKTIREKEGIKNEKN